MLNVSAVSFREMFGVGGARAAADDVKTKLFTVGDLAAESRME